MSVSPIVALVLIGAASLGLSLLNTLTNAALGARLEHRLEILRGVTLIAIGVRTLVEHLA